MKLIYGYEMNSAPGAIGHVVCPPQLSTKITVSPSGNTTRWIFYGTRKQILNWMRENPEISLENNIFAGNKPCDSNVHTEITIDLQYLYDKEQTYTEYVKSFFVDIFETERVKVEIRPRIESRDSFIPAVNRITVANGSKLGEIVDELETEWFKPTPTYIKQTKDLFYDTPTPNHIVSAKPPTSIQVSTQESS